MVEEGAIFPPAGPITKAQVSIEYRGLEDLNNRFLRVIFVFFELYRKWNYYPIRDTR